MESKKDFYYLLYGNSGVGKSSFVNYLKEKSGSICEEAEVGESGKSCTQTPKEFYLDKLGTILLDTMGTHDTKQTNTGAINIELINYLVKSKRMQKKFDAIIYLHLIADVKTDHIAQYIDSLKETLGTEIDKTNVVILLCKAGFGPKEMLSKLEEPLRSQLKKINEQQLSTKVEPLKKQLSSFDSDNIIPWDNVDELDDQYKKLMEAIAKCKPVNLGFMDKIEERIMNCAKEIWEKDVHYKYYKITSDNIEEKISEDTIPYEPWVESISKYVDHTENLSGWRIWSLFSSKRITDKGLASFKITEGDGIKDLEYTTTYTSKTHKCDVVKDNTYVKMVGNTVEFSYEIEFDKFESGHSSVVFTIFVKMKGKKPLLKIRRPFKNYDSIQQIHIDEAIVQVGTEIYNKSREEFIKSMQKNVEKITDESKK